jgi:hypothetical protein
VPEYVPFVPTVRDLAWQNLYQKHRGQIDEQFAFTAFRTAPLVSASTMDAKVVTADMANRMMVWGAIGKPNQREWVAPRGGYEKNDGLYPSGYALFTIAPPNHVAEIEQARLAPKQTEAPQPQRADRRAALDKTRLWKGWIIPAGDADTWLAAGTAAYYSLLQSDDIDKAVEARRLQYRGLKLAPDNGMTHFRIEETKGVLFLDAFRRKLGDDKFLTLMSDFFAANTTKTVTAQSFPVAFEFTEPADGAAYSVSDMRGRLGTAVIVYGTQREAGANRYAAEQLQATYLNQFESIVPIYKDFEVGDEQLAHKDVVFIGRPESNTALAAWSQKLGLAYENAAFKVENHTYASEREALAWAAKNPQDGGHMVLVLAGNDALRTVKLATTQRFDQTPYAITGEVGARTAAAPGRRRP